VEKYGCIFHLGFETNARPRNTRKLLADKTGIECFANHIHIDNYVKTHSIGQLEQGILFANKLAQQLRLSYPRTTFRLIVSHNNRDGATIRFHKLRENEEYLASDLERYEDEAICVLTVLRANN